jgi:RNA polymerase sigma factor (sigma-70 family)
LQFLKTIQASGSDHELIALYKSGESLDVLAELYQRYMELVYGVCLKYMKEPEDAKDAVLNIYEELIIKLKKHEVDNFKGWLYQLSKNHCLMKLRGQKRKPVNVDIDGVQLAENVHLNGEMEKEENFKLMEYCLGQLGEQQRQAIELFYLQQNCYKEVSEKTGFDLNTVKSYIQNGRRNLKICMEKNHELKN